MSFEDLSFTTFKKVMNIRLLSQEKERVTGEKKSLSVDRQFFFLNLKNLNEIV